MRRCHLAALETCKKNMSANERVSEFTFLNRDDWGIGGRWRTEFILGKTIQLDGFRVFVRFAAYYYWYGMLLGHHCYQGSARSWVYSAVRMNWMCADENKWDLVDDRTNRWKKDIRALNTSWRKDRQQSFAYRTRDTIDDQYERLPIDVTDKRANLLA